MWTFPDTFQPVFDEILVYSPKWMPKGFNFAVEVGAFEAEGFGARLTLPDGPPGSLPDQAAAHSFTYVETDSTVLLTRSLG